ncbi:MAG: phenol hydroxylase subunit P4 [Chromatiales bacterium]|jgi:phenol hydroxylase P4 protein|nr:phenol hydroxylase subunit P4 [Chromatiales bacterium]MDX9766560.1 phenol hydroxylase subunit P4 [Ectothiorhodospiraceae bacterium]
MPVKAIRENYAFEPKDVEKNFHGNRIVYVGWDHHLMFCAPVAFPLPPDMPFGALVEQVIPGAFGMHPDFPQIQWNAVQWRLDGEPFTPDMQKSLDANGVRHKSVVRMFTPGLNGIGGSGS